MSDNAKNAKRTSGDRRVDELLDSLRADGVPEAGLLDALWARLANAQSADPDWITYCQSCSALYAGVLDTCPKHAQHRVRAFDANSPSFRDFVAAQRAFAAVEDAMSPSFESELTALINKHGLDVYCSTTDYILAAYITGALEGLRKISQDRQARTDPVDLDLRGPN